MFSAMLMKYNDENYRQDRAFVLTDSAIYNVKKTQVQRRIRYEDLEAISTSTASSEFVLHIKASYDYRFLSYENRTEIIETILSILVNVKKLCTAFKIYEIDLINLNGFMTTKLMFKNKKSVRPPEKFAKIMDLDKYNEKLAHDNERTTNMRKRTTVLFKKEKQENVEICIEDFELLKLLGKGAFGKVILAQKKDTKKIYAIKILVKKHIIEQDQLDHTKAEKLILWDSTMRFKPMRNCTLFCSL
jgi:serum/glucocorticoid-regulated kinase 2